MGPFNLLLTWLTRIGGHLVYRNKQDAFGHRKPSSLPYGHHTAFVLSMSRRNANRERQNRLQLAVLGNSMPHYALLQNTPLFLPSHGPLQGCPCICTQRVAYTSIHCRAHHSALISMWWRRLGLARVIHPRHNLPVFHSVSTEFCLNAVRRDIYKCGLSLGPIWMIGRHARVHAVHAAALLIQAKSQTHLLN